MLDVFQYLWNAVPKLTLTDQRPWYKQVVSGLLLSLTAIIKVAAVVSVLLLFLGLGIVIKNLGLLSLLKCALYVLLMAALLILTAFTINELSIWCGLTTKKEKL